MKVFEFEIVETLKRMVAIEAESEAEAEMLIESRYQDGDYILDSGDFTDYEIKLKQGG